MDSIHCVKYWHLPASYFSHISETFYFSLFDIKHVLLLAFDIRGCLRFSDFDITAALFGNNADGGDSGFGELLGTNIMIKKD